MGIRRWTKKAENREEWAVIVKEALRAGAVPWTTLFLSLPKQNYNFSHYSINSLII